MLMHQVRLNCLLLGGVDHWVGFKELNPDHITFKAPMALFCSPLHLTDP